MSFMSVNTLEAASWLVHDQKNLLPARHSTGASWKSSALSVTLLYISGLHRLYLKLWNHQLQGKAIQPGATYCVPGHAQNISGCMWTNVFVFCGSRELMQ